MLNASAKSKAVPKAALAKSESKYYPYLSIEESTEQCPPLYVQFFKDDPKTCMNASFRKSIQQHKTQRKP